MTYDLTLLNNLTNPVQYFYVINVMSNNLFGGMVIVLLYFIIFMLAGQEYFPNLLLAASFFITTITVFMWFIGLGPAWYVSINLVALSAAIMIKWWGQSGNS